MALILKLDETTKAPIVTPEQKIIYIDDQDPDKKELPLDPAAMYAKIGDLGNQNKKDRDNYRDLRDKFKPVMEIEDFAEWHTKATEALTTVENFNDKDWMKADKVDKLKADMKESYEAKLTGKDTILSTTLKDHATQLGTKDQQIRTLMVSNQFSGSPYFVGEKKKTNLPPDIGEAYFGKHFKVEEQEGKSVLRAYYEGGEPIISKLNPGEPAGFHEAMGIIIDLYPGKDSILVATSGGSGGPGGLGDDEDADDLASLKKQHKEALAAGNTQVAIGLKNKIFNLEQASKK
ncbi:MAG: hypothetical protein PF503_06280 [Desulfobacula sp.]|jgi:hypothetical protein|nr:hypothetical protein [Desulfobacula sp.]